jgi:small GTP-binding protein
MSGRENDTEDYIKCKVVLLGKSGVGKTSIINRYISNSFKDSVMSTPGANFTVKKVEFPEEKEKIKFEIWDTAGQEKYKSLAKVFYNNASSCILVYDITSKPSFEDIKNYWVPELRENVPQNTSMQLLILILIILYDFSTCFGW